jgi:hypothetical protein
MNIPLKKKERRVNVPLYLDETLMHILKSKAEEYNDTQSGIANQIFYKVFEKEIEAMSNVGRKVLSAD